MGTSSPPRAFGVFLHNHQVFLPRHTHLIPFVHYHHARPYPCQVGQWLTLLCHYPHRPIHPAACWILLISCYSYSDHLIYLGCIGSIFLLLVILKGTYSLWIESSNRFVRWDQLFLPVASDFVDWPAFSFSCLCNRSMKAFWPMRRAPLCPLTKL